MAIIARSNRLEGRVFLEIGANIGTQTIYAALSGKFSQNVAIEPEPRNVHLLGDNCSMNDLEIHVEIVQPAVGPNNVQTYLSRHASDSGMHATALQPIGNAGLCEMETVPSIFGKLAIAESQIGFVWMDIERFEFSVFPTMMGIITNKCPIFFEYARTDISDAEYEHWCGVFNSKTIRHLKLPAGLQEAR